MSRKKGRQSVRNSTTSPQTILMAERRRQAVELRVQGGSFPAIATQLAGTNGISDKYDHSQAFRDVTYELERIQKASLEKAQQVKTLMVLRMEELHAALWPYASQGDVVAVDRVMRLIDMRLKLEGMYPQPAAKEAAGPRGSSTSVTEVSSGGGIIRITEVEVELRSSSLFAEIGDSQMIDVTASAPS